MAGRQTAVQFEYVLLQILKEPQIQQVKMSTDPKYYAPLIIQNLDFETTGVYLLQRGVLSVVDYYHFRKALRSGALTNSDVLDQLLQKILEKPQEFYQALRDYVIDKGQDVHPSNKELFDKLPENFVSVQACSDIMY